MWASVSSWKTAVYVAVMYLCAFFVHMALVEQYYHQCRSNIFQVLFMRDSTFCSAMDKVIVAIEGGYNTLFKSALPQLMLT